MELKNTIKQTSLSFYQKTFQKKPMQILMEASNEKSERHKKQLNIFKLKLRNITTKKSDLCKDLSKLSASSFVVIDVNTN